MFYFTVYWFDVLLPTLQTFRKWRSTCDIALGPTHIAVGPVTMEIEGIGSVLNLHTKGGAAQPSKYSDIFIRPSLKSKNKRQKQHQVKLEISQ